MKKESRQRFDNLRDAIIFGKILKYIKIYKNNFDFESIKPIKPLTLEEEKGESHSRFMFVPTFIK